MTPIPKVIDQVVNNDMCIGCGLCVYSCPSKAIEMKWNDYGFLVPEVTGKCDGKGKCINVCPFNPFPDEIVKTENELAKIFLRETKLSHEKIGRYNAIYAGYANDFRVTSSSGGLATYILSELLESGIVDHVISVHESQKPNTHYEYALISDQRELIKSSKTKYYPVTLSEALTKTRDLEGRVAVIGVACFIKAIRLAQHEDLALKEKIAFLIGIICGGVKSRFFTEYLSDKAGVMPKNCLNPRFRIKDTKSSASDYSFGCKDKSNDNYRIIRMRNVGDMWGTGLFKANACDFCDDVTNELADVSLGDAWLAPYRGDGHGTNVIVTRSKLADRLIKSGIEDGKLHIEVLALDRFLASQQGSFNHRHTGLSARIHYAKGKNKLIPPKRFGTIKLRYDFKVVQRLRMKVRRKSLEVWRATPSKDIFDKEMKRDLFLLRRATIGYHFVTKVIRKLEKVFGKK